MRPESSGVLSQAWHWVRPPQRPLRPAPLPPRVWPLWLGLPWSSAPQPRAALRSTLPLASPALLDRSSTTVSSAAASSRHLLHCHGNPSPPYTSRGWGCFFFPADTLMCSCCSASGQCLFPGACLPCNKGFYQPLSGQQQCWPCNRGYYTKYTHCLNHSWRWLPFCLLHSSNCVSSITGSPLCNPCPAGSFNNNTGADSCTSCSPGLLS